MPDISMCSAMACPVAGRCYRNPQSGTKPDAELQSWAEFDPAAGERCNAFWPVATPASDVDVRIDHLESDDQPNADEVASAPVIDGWRIVPVVRVDDGSQQSVVAGHVSGHSKIENESKIRTSFIVKIAADRRWVRSQNSLYLLGSRSTEMPLALHAATRPTWMSAWALVRIATGAHVVSAWVLAAAVAAGDPKQSWPRRRTAAAAVGDEMSRCGRSDIAAAWWNLSADPADPHQAEYVHERLVNAAGRAPSPEAMTVIAGWEQLAKGLEHDVDLSDPVAAARLIGERVGGTPSVEVNKVIRADADEFCGTDAFKELKIDIDAPSAIDALKPADEPELSGIVVLAAIGGTTHTTAGKEVEREFAAIACRHLPFVVADGIAGVRTTLRNEFPHLHDAIDVLLSDLVEGEPIRLRATLLVGPPGGGKSRMARRMAECLQVGLHRFDGGAANDSTFGGTPRRWTSGEHCVPLEAVRRYAIANPWILVDEVDKAGISGGYNGSLANALLPFLEIETSQNFPDPYVQSGCNLSFIGHILTANDDTILPAPLRDRLRVVRLPEPTVEHLIPIARGIIADIAKERGGDRRWWSDLDDGQLAIAEGLWPGGSVRRLRAIVERLLAYRESRPRN